MMTSLHPGAILGIETTGRLTGVALLERGRLVGQSALDIHASSAELLIDQTERLLRAHGKRPSDLARIGIDLGPGSFTGVRIGLAAGRGLAWGAGVPVVAVSSHQALAWPWRELGRVLVLATGLRRGQVFLEAGEWSSDVWTPHVEAASVPVEEVAERLSALAPRGRLLFLGEAVESIWDLTPELRLLGERIRDPLASTRRPEVVAFLAARPDETELRGPELGRLEPVYLRGADARRPSARA